MKKLVSNKAIGNSLQMYKVIWESQQKQEAIYFDVPELIIEKSDESIQPKIHVLVHFSSHP
jgi:hypothetical protein